MSGCEQSTDWEVVTNSLIGEAGGVWPIEIHSFSCYKVFGTVVLEGRCCAVVLTCSFVVANAHSRLPDWWCFPALSALLADFFQDTDPEWMLRVLAPFTNRRKSITHLVWVMDFACAWDDPAEVLAYLDAHFGRKRCLFLFDKAAFDASVWEGFKAAGFDDMEGSRFGVCGRFFATRWRKIKVAYMS